MSLSKAEAARLNGKKGGRPRKDRATDTLPALSPSVSVHKTHETHETQRTHGTHPLLNACTRKEQAFLLALLADPQQNQTKAYESVFKAKGDSARANAAKCLAKDRVRKAWDALRGVVADAVVDEAISTALERRQLLTKLQRDAEVHPLARLKAVDIHNKMDGDYVKDQPLPGQAPAGPVELRITVIQSQTNQAVVVQASA